MIRPLKIALLIFALGVTQARAGVFDDEEARRLAADLKIKTEARFDQQGKSLLDLANQMQSQSEEIARLRGQVETLNYELETAKKRQQDFYLDLDTRLRKLEPQVAGSAPADSVAGAKPPAAADPGQENKEYEAALNQFKANKYKEAAWGFSAFVQKHPNSSLAPNAQFWLGNAWVAQRNCAKAIDAHGVVTTKYADSPKAPDSWLAMANCQHEMGNQAAARRSLDTLIAKYPNSPAAGTAREQLKKK
ncbi:MAG: tol-pal system protein YbgF [Azonexus sp.]